MNIEKTSYPTRQVKPARKFTEEELKVTFRHEFEAASGLPFNSFRKLKILRQLDDGFCGLT